MTPIRFPNLDLTISIGKAKSESLEITAASSKSFKKQSTRRWVARSTSVLFSSIL